jgi:hypothetical protein
MCAVRRKVLMAMIMNNADQRKSTRLHTNTSQKAAIYMFIFKDLLSSYEQYSRDSGTVKMESISVTAEGDESGIAGNSER